MTVHLYALSSQHDHVQDVLTFLSSTGLAVEHSYTDLNADAQAILTKFNLTVQPVLFDLVDINGVDTVTKFAEGAAITTLTAEQIAAVKTALEKVPTPAGQ
jgi:hypothetical protein